MKLRSLLLLPLLVCSASLADEASHREAAARFLELVKADKALIAGFQRTIEPITATLRRQGMPEEGITEAKEAIDKWFTEEIKWEDIKPKMLDVYVQQFSETELKELVAFYQTPTGQKALETMPVVTQQGAAIGREYGQQKAELLHAKLKEIADKYAPKKEK